jgi:hypothetical protein
MSRAARSSTSANTTPQIAITMTQGPQPSIEQHLHSVFASAVATLPVADPVLIVAHANDLLGRGCSAALEAERGAWSRYRIAVRVQGMPVTIATVELMLPG